MHGFGLLAGLKRHGHLHDEALHLRLHGVLAYAPNVVPYNTVGVRSAMWAERLERILEETGAERVHLVAHSMGGLDARHLIAALGFHARVATLTTLATPHRGSSIASFVLDHPGVLQRRAAAFTDWAGSSVLEGATSDVLRALVELTPAYLTETFNPAAPDHPAVRYRSYAGRAGRGTDVPISPMLRVQNTLLYGREGVNDGLVSVASAAWGTFLGTVDADHAAQVGLRVGLGGRFRSAPFFLDLARQLAADEVAAEAVGA